MVNLILFALACYGISNIIIFGSIFEKFRNFLLKHDPNFFGKLFSCMICLPTWIGGLISYFVYSPTIQNHFATGYLANFLDGCIASGLVWLIHTIQESFEK